MKTFRVAVTYSCAFVLGGYVTAYAYGNYIEKPREEWTSLNLKAAMPKPSPETWWGCKESAVEYARICRQRKVMEKTK